VQCVVPPAAFPLCVALRCPRVPVKAASLQIHFNFPLLHTVSWFPTDHLVINHPCLSLSVSRSILALWQGPHCSYICSNVPYILQNIVAELSYHMSVSSAYPRLMSLRDLIIFPTNMVLQPYQSTHSQSHSMVSLHSSARACVPRYR
jgi:hypothetical protein